MKNPKELPVLEAAAALFLRHGYRRVTMGEIAKGAGMSRPSLYLVFADKEAILKAVVKAIGEDLLEQIRSEVARKKSVRAKLELACELWTVRPYDQFHDSPDAKELLDATRGLAGEEVLANYAEFEKILAAILADGKAARKQAGLTPKAVAHVFAVALRGFKEQVADGKDLRKLVKGLVSMTLASLGTD